MSIPGTDAAPAASTETPQPISMDRAARGSTANLIGAFTFGVTNFALTIAVTHALTRANAGVFFATTSLFLLATSIGQLGTGTGLVYFLSRCRALGTTNLIGAYLRAAVKPVMVTAIGMAVAMFAFAQPLAEWINPQHAGQATTDLQILALFIPFAGLENVALAATRGLGTMKANAVVEQIGRPIVQLVLVAAAAFLVASGGVLSFAWAFSYAPAALLGWVWLRRLRRRHVSVIEQSHESRMREFWKFSAPRSLASVAQLAMQRMDIVLVAALAGVVQAAIYTGATRFIVAGQMGRNAVSLAVQPQLAEAMAKDDRHSANRLYQVSTAWLMMVTWPLYLFLIIFGTTLLHIFGRGYNAGTVVLVLLSVSMLIATLCGDVDVVLIMARKTTWSLGNVLLGLSLQIGLDIWLIPEHGLLGAAIGWSVAIAVKNLSALLQISISMGLQPFGPSSFAAAGASVIAFGLVPTVVRLVAGQTWLAVAVALAVGTVVYLGLLWVLRAPLELSALRAVRRRRGRAGAAPAAG